ncbi:SDR family oxidoreductase [Nocardia bovistercoris]|uniref:SDR family oxidoreductase n=1 Tax=Nocardia bovistercoris TaxID=2785916 RepID=A0A931IBG5_9NOCA|nr:SDR family oxidoreductase [Nocardia bovistercoris]MBH0777390.1 SDR family oxidoreductase [Nocardia bovistercoris]
MEISGKIAIVTGAGGGIGAAVAKQLAGAGARVVVADLDADAVAAVADGLGAAAVAVGGDVTDEKVLGAAIEAAETAFGPVDIFVANAGIGGGPGLDSTEEQWSAAFEVNVMAHVRAARLLVPGWLARGGGYFVSVASAAGLLTQIGSAPYSVTKHAAVGFAEWLSVTYGAQGIRVSCVCPMGVDTRLLDGGLIPGNPAAGDLAIRAVRTAGPVLSTEQAAEVIGAGIEAEHFLILPHPEVLKMYRNKGSDYDRWLDGMRRYQAALGG